MKKVGFLSFGHWSDAPGSATRSASDVLPCLTERSIRVMAYSPIEQGKLLGHAALSGIATRLGATPAQVALVRLLRRPGVMAIPKLGRWTMSARTARWPTSCCVTGISLDSTAPFSRPTRRRPLEML